MLYDLIDQTKDETRCFKIDILLTNSEIAYIYTHTHTDILNIFWAR